MVGKIRIWKRRKDGIRQRYRKKSHMLTWEDKAKIRHLQREIDSIPELSKEAPLERYILAEKIKRIKG